MAKTKKDKNTLISHLSELRKRLMVSIICFFVAMSICLSKAEYITNQLLALAEGFEFVYVAPAELMMAYIKISIICGIVTTFPIICYELWMFIRPGLTRRERKAVFFIMTFGMLLLFCGVYFAYEVILPVTLKYFSGLSTDESINSMISVQNYLNFVINMLLTFGIVFELPVVIILLTQLGLINPKLLRKQRKYVILVTFIIAAIITPPDVISQVMVALPMLLLFEMSTILSSFLFRKKLKKMEMELAENEDCDEILKKEGMHP